MKNKLLKNISVTVGIPTCYGSENLIKTVESIRKSKGIEKLEIIISADRTPINSKIKDRLKKLGVKLIWNSKEGSQVKKLEQIIKLVKTDLFVSTQDDIFFEKHTLSSIVKAFEKDRHLTMLGVRILPLAPVNKVQSALASMLRAVDTIGRHWNKGNNHLMASGRCLAYDAKFVKKFRMPHEVINCDMFFYLENKRLNGKFNFSEDANVLIACPKNLKEQLGTSNRYQYSNEELKNYFNFDISNEYKIPLRSLLKGFSSELASNLSDILFYLGIFVYTRIKKQNKSITSNTKWEVETSTKI